MVNAMVNAMVNELATAPEAAVPNRKGQAACLVR
jgi:hypothetical protein